MNKLRSERKKAGLSQIELSKRSGVCRSAIIKLESSDKPTQTRVETLLKLAKALDLSVSELFLS